MTHSPQALDYVDRNLPQWDTTRRKQVADAFDAGVESCTSRVSIGEPFPITVSTAQVLSREQIDRIQSAVRSAIDGSVPSPAPEMRATMTVDTSLLGIERSKQLLELSKSAHITSDERHLVLDAMFAALGLVRESASPNPLLKNGSTERTVSGDRWILGARIASEINKHLGHTNSLGNVDEKCLTDIAEALGVEL